VAYEHLPSTADLAMVAAANESGKRPVVLLPGIVPLDSSWANWMTYFEDAGYAGLSPGWPRDAPAAARVNGGTPAAADAGGVVAGYQQAVIERLVRTPALIGFSYGGLLAQVLAGRGLSAATVAVAPSSSRGVLPLPTCALAAATACPADRDDGGDGRQAVVLPFAQFRLGYGNAISLAEARELHDRYHLGSAGLPIPAAALAGLSSRRKIRPDRTNPARGPLLIIAGSRDHQVPWAAARAVFRKQSGNAGVTEIVEIAGRGHTLTIDSGWPEVARVCLSFIGRFG
jgi:non-heme chloroperoxidase